MEKKKLELGSEIWKGLESKGKLATLLGLLFTLPANGYFLYLYFTGGAVGIDQPTQLLWLNIIGWGWFILPSKMSLKSTAFTFELED